MVKPMDECKMRLESCRLCSDRVRTLDVTGEAMKASGGGEAGAGDDAIYCFGQRESLDVMWGEEGNRRFWEQTIAMFQTMGEGRWSKADRFRVSFRCLADSTC